MKIKQNKIEKDFDKLRYDHHTTEKHFEKDSKRLSVDYLNTKKIGKFNSLLKPKVIFYCQNEKNSECILYKKIKKNDYVFTVTIDTRDKSISLVVNKDFEPNETDSDTLFEIDRLVRPMHVEEN